MNKLLLHLCSISLVTTFVVSCTTSDDSTDTAINSDPESTSGSDDGDMGSDESSDPLVCGGDQESCCYDSCEDPYDPVISPLNQSCTCQPPCAFEACTAGVEDGHCAQLFELETFHCFNAVDFPPDMSSNDCVDGERCTTDSGDEDGICVVMANPILGGELARCAVQCDTPPEDCGAGMMCSPGFAVEGTHLIMDYSDSHCAPIQ